MKYTDVIKGLLFSLHSRRFLLAIIGAHLSFGAHKLGVPNEIIAMMMTPITAFILGESYNDGQANKLK